MWTSPLLAYLVSGCISSVCCLRTIGGKTGLSEGRWYAAGRMAVAVDQGVRRALARARAGKALSVREAEWLLEARGVALDELLAISSHLHDLGHGMTITYSRKVFVPLTMLCRDHCHYCTFAKPPARLEKPFLTPDEVVAVAAAG